MAFYCCTISVDADRGGSRTFGSSIVELRASLKHKRALLTASIISLKNSLRHRAWGCQRIIRDDHTSKIACDSEGPTLFILWATYRCILGLTYVGLWPWGFGSRTQHQVLLGFSICYYWCSPVDSMWYIYRCCRANPRGCMCDDNSVHESINIQTKGSPRMVLITKRWAQYSMYDWLLESVI